MNVFTAVCRIGADAEQRYTQGGDSIVSFNGAVDSGFGQISGAKGGNLCCRT